MRVLPTRWQRKPAGILKLRHCHPKYTHFGAVCYLTKKLCKKLRGPSKFWGSGPPSGFAHGREQSTIIGGPPPLAPAPRRELTMICRYHIVTQRRPQLMPRIKLFTPVARIVLCIIYWSAYWRRPFNCRSHPLITNNWIGLLRPCFVFNLPLCATHISDESNSTVLPVD